MARRSPLQALGRRPLVLFVLALAAGLALRDVLGVPLLCLPAGLLLALSAAGVRALPPWVLAAGFLAGSARVDPDGVPLPAPAPPGLPCLVRLAGRVASAPKNGEQGEASFLLATRHGVLRATWSEPDRLLGRGDRLELTGWARPRTGPGALDSSWQVRTHGTNLRLVSRAGWTRPLGLLDRVRQALRLRLDTALQEPARAMALCLLLGEGERLDPWDRLCFRQTGTAHLLVVSGLHVVLLAGLILRVLPRTWSPAALAPVLAYALLAGGRPPALRAAVGFGIWLLAPRLGRRRDLPCTLATAALPLLLAAPQEIQGASFQISYGAVAALGHLGPPLERLARRIGLPQRLAATAGLSAAATLGTAPILLHHFGSFSPLSLVLTPLLTPVLGLAVFCSGLSLVLPGLAGPILGWIHGGMLGLLGWVDTLPATPVHACSWPGPWAILAGLAAGLPLLMAARAGLRPMGAVALCLPFFLPAARLSGGEPARAKLLDVGHGQCLLLDLPGMGLVIHDAGSLWHERNLARALDRTLRQWGRRRVDLLVVSHGDRDHVNGLPLLLGGYPVRWAVLPDHPSAGGTARRLAGQGIPLTRVPAGGQLVLSRQHTRLFLLRPGDGRGTSNQESLALHVRAPGFSLLSPGDLEGPPLRALIRLGPALSAATLVAPHHGRALEVETELTRVFQVRTVLISRAASAGPPPARAAYRAAGARVRWTADEGDLEVMAPTGP